MKKLWKFKPTEPVAVNQLIADLGVSPILANLLYHRGIQTKEAAQQYFDPSYDHLHDPFLLKDMSLGVDRLDQALAKDERILLYGDYDVDGVTSVSLLFLFLKRFTNNVDYYIPDRYKEGYGLTMQGMDYAKQNNIKLIIAMDCGTTAIAAIQVAKENGIDVIVLDHHLPDKTLPPTVALINPKQKDCPYPFKGLSGCGVTFKFAQAYAKHKEIPQRALTPLMDLVAISIACDYVPIVDENRVLATLGLTQLNQFTRVGLKALITKTNYSYPFSMSDIVFGIGPYINAAGRLSDGKEAVRLLLAEDWLVATEYANILRKRNDQRRIFDRNNLNEAIEIWEQNESHKDVPVIFLFQSNWHKGVLGIVASRMAKQYHKPAVIMCESNGEIVASARSTSVDIHAVLAKSEKLFTSFGGHPNAAGFTINPEYFEALSESVHREMKVVAKHRKPLELKIDSALELKNITPNFVAELRKLEPFGPGNPNPLFVCEDVEVAGPIRHVENTNLRLLVQKGASGIFNAVGFRKGDFLGQIDSPIFTMCFKIIENNWHGKRKLQLQLKDVIEGKIEALVEEADTKIAFSDS